MTSLNKANLNPDPLKQFNRWFQQALNANLPHPNAMTLATASKAGSPSTRTVLLKEFDENGFVFYTSYDSPKSSDLAKNTTATLLFYWAELARLVKYRPKNRSNIFVPGLWAVN